MKKTLQDGHNIIIHCHSGLGRSGMVGAMLLMEFGMTADDAMAKVRESDPNRIETDEQEAFVRNFAPVTRQ